MSTETINLIQHYLQCPLSNPERETFLLILSPQLKMLSQRLEDHLHVNGKLILI